MQSPDGALAVFMKHNNYWVKCCFPMWGEILGYPWEGICLKNHHCFSSYFFLANRKWQACFPTFSHSTDFVKITAPECVLIESLLHSLSCQSTQLFLPSICFSKAEDPSGEADKNGWYPTKQATLGWYF